MGETLYCEWGTLYCTGSIGYAAATLCVDKTSIAAITKQAIIKFHANVTLMRSARVVQVLQDSCVFYGRCNRFLACCKLQSGMFCFVVVVRAA